MLLFALLPRADAVEPRWAFESSYDNVGEGDWYRDYYDDYAPYLNGSESYVMSGLLAMFRATGDPTYLERLVWHADGVLAQRNDARGVTDWTGLESPCWRDMYYTGGRPFCWVLHSGVIIDPMIEFARLVQESGLGDEVAWDGLTFDDKAAAYVAAAEETVAWHDAEWSDGGYYVIPFDARFLGDEAGGAYPLNCSNAMGRALLRLHDVTGDPAYLDKATALAAYFRDNLVTRGDGYVWPYYGDDIIELGENISYGALNTSFAAMAHARGVVFTDDDMARFRATLLENIVVDDRTFYASLNGGDTNVYDYQAETYHWLQATPADPAVYTVVRNLYELAYPAADNTSGTRLEGWATLAEHEPPVCAATLPAASWTADGDGWYTALLAEPTVEVSGGPCFLPLPVDAPGAVQVRFGDEDVADWQATGGELVRHVPVYAGQTQLTLVHDPSLGALRAREVPPGMAPRITSAAPARGTVGTDVAYVPTGEGDAPVWWSLATFPTGARVDPATGTLTWIPAADGVYTFTLRLENVVGDATQAFAYCVGADCPEPDTGGDTGGDTAPDTAGDTADPVTDTADTRPEADPPAATPEARSGCACSYTSTSSSRGRGAPPPRNAPPVVLFALAAAVSLARRRAAASPPPLRHAHAALVALAALLGGCGAPALPADTGAPVDTAADPDTADPDTAPDSGDTAPDTGDTAPDTADTAPDTDTADTADTAPDTSLPDDDRAVAVTAGQAHTCALLDDGRVLCWGSDTSGRLDAPEVAFVSLVAGFHHTCGVTAAGELHCWGVDTDGQSTVPAGTYAAVAPGYRATVAVTAAGALSFWGSPYEGVALVPAGDDFASASCGQYHCCAVHATGEGECWGYWGLNTVPADTTFRVIETGAYHTCGLTDAGTATCWGYGDDGRTEPPADPLVDLACGAVHCCGLRADGTATCWGTDDSGQATPPAGATFVDLAAGGYHTCGVSSDGDVACWGNDAQGQGTVPATL